MPVDSIVANVQLTVSKPPIKWWITAVQDLLWKGCPLYKLGLFSPEVLSKEWICGSSECHIVGVFTWLH